MNIDEERKAFESFYTVEYGTPLLVLATLRTESGYSTKANENVSRAFVAWLAAKADAVEMAKPCLTVGKTMGGKWGLYKPEGSRAYHITETEDDAVKWAIDNGYRVIEE